ncbi:MAG: DUF4405 domain-containing protein [Rhodospirillum sp.]|nr:DUF4405 domain-containing protein [Rhodospirillum sp.]MCF8489268.1 DUF4405 domain-containing protein [Rhodospirillum sp.]MCF8502725.1 DUF4405 domain-containing protein [Rhodospirillum sp.]
MSTQSASDLLKRDVVTPVTAIIFLAIGVTGVMLFFHFGEAWVKEGHEWLGLVFVAAAAWHLFRHWRGFSGYFRRGLPRAVLALSLVVSAGVIALTAHGDDDNGGFSPRALITAMENAPLTKTAVIMGLEPSALEALLQEKGWTGAGPNASALSLGAAAGVNPMAILAAVHGAAQGGPAQEGAAQGSPAQ